MHQGAQALGGVAIDDVSVHAAGGGTLDLRGIGVKLVSGGDTVLSAGRDATFDALQNAYYVRASGWSIGFVAPAFSIVAAALRGGDDPQLLLSLRELFGDLPDAPRFAEEVRLSLASLYQLGARAALANVLR